MRRVGALVALLAGLTALAPAQAPESPTRQRQSQDDVLAGPEAPEASRAEAVVDAALGLGDLLESRDRLAAAAQKLRGDITSAREHLHDADPVEGGLPPLDAMTTEQLVRTLLDDATAEGSTPVTAK